MFKALFAVAMAATFAGTAQADVRWFVTGTFDDGASLSGWFDINQYGFLSKTRIKTGNGTAFVGRAYQTPGQPGNNDAFYIGVYPDLYDDGLELHFTSDLNVGVASNALLTSSFECRDAFCFPGRTTTRYLVSGYASISRVPGVPEPASWALLIGGFAIAGAAMRVRSTRCSSHQPIRPA